MTGSKTNEQLHRQLERKPDVGEARQAEGKARAPDRNARQGEFAVSAHGTNQESEHAKHNRSHKGAARR